MEAVDSVSELPRGSNYAYHATDHRNLNAILSDGVDSSYSSDKWRGLNTFFESVADAENIQNKPSDRAECTFCFPRFADISGDSANSVIAVDLREIRGPLFRGSYHTATQVRDIIQPKLSSVGQDLTELKDIDGGIRRAYELAVDYWRGLSMVKPPVTRGGELLIEEDISPDAIYQYTTPE